MDMTREKAEYGIQAGTAVILPVEKMGEYYIEPLGQVADKPVYSFIKRTFDIVASAVALLILFVPMLIIGLAVCLTSEGGPLFIQERLGKDGRPFKMIKFRTMKKDAESEGAQWSKGERRLLPASGGEDPLRCGVHKDSVSVAGRKDIV